MKKLLIVFALLTIAASIAAVTIETTYDTTFTGDLMYRADKVFYIMTAHGKTPVLEEEIVKVYNSTGEDITTSFLNTPSRESKQGVETQNRIYLVNASTIAAPIWILALTSAASLIIALSATK